MKKIISIMAGLIISGFIVSASAISASAHTTGSASEFAQRWDVIKYQTTDKDARIAAYEKLITDAKTAAQNDSNNAAPKVWAAISLATLGGEVGAMGGALAKVKEAKKLLESALTQHPNLELETSIHTTLGSLYYQVPGWPIGFGDDDKAVEHLKKALQLNPTSLGANFWMGSYLWEETDQYEAAGRHFIQAIASPARPGREMADKGRKAEAAKLLAAVEKKLHHKVTLQTSK